MTLSTPSQDSVPTDLPRCRPPSLRGLRRRLLAEQRAQRRSQLQHQLKALVQEELRTQVATYLAVPGEERLVAASIQRSDDVVDEIIRLRQELSVLAGEEGARALRREATLRRELQGQGSGSSGSSGGGGSRDSKAFACSVGKQPKGLTLGDEQLPPRGLASASAAEGEEVPAAAAVQAATSAAAGSACHCRRHGGGGGRGG